tara:strand:- start:32649 stop:33950 length:1302 start_codon:yes stop_codon:yes gene_type:complete
MKAFITSFILFFLTIFIPKFHLHASTIKSIFDNNNLENTVGVKAIKINNTIAVFAAELSDNLQDHIKQNLVFVAKENDGNSYDWKKFALDPELNIPLIITHNNKKVVVIGTDRNNQNLYTIIQDYDSFSHSESLVNTENLFTADKKLLLLNYSEKLKINIDKKNIINTKNSMPSAYEIQYFWSGYDNNILNIWLTTDNILFTLNIDSMDFKTQTLPLDIKNKKTEKIIGQKLNYINGSYYIVYDIDNSNNPSSYGINHRIFYSYNFETWHEAAVPANLGDYEILLTSQSLGNNLLYQSFNIDFSTFKTTANLWKVNDALMPWDKLNTKLESDAFISSLKHIDDQFNIITMKLSNQNSYNIKYFVTSNLDNFDMNTAKPEINNTVNTNYTNVFYLNVEDNNSNINYLEKHTAFNLNGKNKTSNNLKFELLKVQP